MLPVEWLPGSHLQGREGVRSGMEPGSPGKPWTLHANYNNWERRGGSGGGGHHLTAAPFFLLALASLGPHYAQELLLWKVWLVVDKRRKR